MQGFLFLLAVYLFAALVILPIWAFVKFRSQDAENRALRAGLERLQRAIDRLQNPPAPDELAPSPSRVDPPPPVAVPPPLATTTLLPLQAVGPILQESSAPSALPEAFAAVSAATSADSPLAARLPAEPPLLPLAGVRPGSIPVQKRAPAIEWEQFMGAKLFAWLGGLALFLGVAFFVKYSFEHDLIPPEVRVALGFVFGIALVVGGWRIPRTRYAITAQTLVGAGIVSLYAVSFACNSIYRFSFFGPLPTFLSMTLITAMAFMLAVRMNAQAVALLGILGGFLTPLLLSTGVDNAVGLFGYLSLLVVGLSAVALHRKWLYLVALGAAGVIWILLGWTGRFYVPAKTIVAMIVCVGFSVLFFLVYLCARRWERAALSVLGAALALPAVSLGFAFFFLDESSVAARPGLLFPFVLIVDSLLLALVWLDLRARKLAGAVGLAVFVFLALWTKEALTDALLLWGLGAFLVFAVLHALFPLALPRQGANARASWGTQLFPPLGLLLMLLPLFELETSSFLLWPAILLIDVLALALAVVTGSLFAVAAVLALTLVATAISLFTLPTTLPAPLSLLGAIAGFALFFFAACLWLASKRNDRTGFANAGGQASPFLGSTANQLPAFAALLPFVLLVMVCARLPVPDPSAVFGLGLLLVLLVSILTRWASIAWLPLCGLLGIAAVEYAWHALHFDSSAPERPLAWHLGFYAFFAFFPFIFRRRFAAMTGPWAVAALSGVVHFWLVYATLKPGWPPDWRGAIPALFTLLPLASVLAIVRSAPVDESRRLDRLAWFGGVALFFVTLVFPIQFEREWLTVAWALEGAALLWFYRRVPHPGLRGTGTALLAIAFVRLAMNPAVLSYRVRGEGDFWNWYLYTYGIAIAALFVSARLVAVPPGTSGAKPYRTAFGIDAQALFASLGVILAFLLLNIEIAHFFTPPGTQTLAFQFSGSFAQDMTYTIAWASFALALLVAGIRWSTRAARYAAIVLLSVALLKLFLHDLARLEALYRIAALFAVAVIAILASVVYQRFLPHTEKTRSNES